MTNNSAPWIAAISAILAPVLTAIINNIYNALMERRKILKKHNLDIIDNYISGVGLKLRNESYREFAEFQGKIFLSVPQKYWSEIELLNEFVNTHKKDEATLQLVKVSRLLAKYYRSLQK